MDLFVLALLENCIHF